MVVLRIRGEPMGCIKMHGRDWKLCGFMEFGVWTHIRAYGHILRCNGLSSNEYIKAQCCEEDSVKTNRQNFLNWRTTI